MSISLSVIIPVYNEAQTIGQVLTLLSTLPHITDIIVVDDASTDGTGAIVAAQPDAAKITMVRHPQNYGKGAAIRTALPLVRNAVVVIQDADLEYDPSDLTKFVNLILKFKPDVILGSRFNYDRYSKSHNFFNKIGNHFLSFLFNIFFNTTFTDIYCCYFCFKKKLIDPKNLKTYGFEQQAEILAKCVKNSNSFYEVPVNYSGRSALEGKKIKFYHVFSVIKEIIKNRII
jgi:glycosyltransferase involved in cell wall biosynthesis